MNNVRLIGYVKNSNNAHTTKELAVIFGLTYPRMYHQLVKLAKSGLLQRIIHLKQYYYGYVQGDIDWIGFYATTFEGKVFPQKTRIDWDQVLREVHKPVRRATIFDRIRWKIYDFRVWLANRIYPT